MSCEKDNNSKKKWREVCLAKLLLKLTVLQFKEALRLAFPPSLARLTGLFRHRDTGISANRAGPIVM